MKRDKELARLILTTLEIHDQLFYIFNLNLKGYSKQQVKDHITILIDAGLIATQDLVDSSHEHSDVYPFKIRLTWKGHDYLEGQSA